MLIEILFRAQSKPLRYCSPKSSNWMFPVDGQAAGSKLPLMVHAACRDKSITSSSVKKKQNSTISSTIDSSKLAVTISNLEILNYKPQVPFHGARPLLVCCHTLWLSPLRQCCSPHLSRIEQSSSRFPSPAKKHIDKFLIESLKMSMYPL